ncbi:transketolase [Streptomyces sp. NPDC052701]|uniref:transketolase n=1 Tax=Streptomyces sp. NPDC052701 TaxID=3155533 RepID=UPI003424BA4E
MTLSGYDAYRQELTAVAARDGRVVCLAAPAAGAGHPFELTHPDRFFGLPRTASTMVDVVSGLVAAGFRPFICVGPGPRGRGTAGGLGLRIRYLEAGATVVTPYTDGLDDYPALRRLPGVTLAAPCGEAETRAVVRAAASCDRPFHIRVGFLPRPYWPPADLSPQPLPSPVVWDAAGVGDEAVCLVSVDEDGTALARAARTAAPWLGHAHLLYLDDAHLRRASDELAGRHRRFVVTGARPGSERVTETLTRLLPGREVATGRPVGRRADSEVAELLRAAHRLAACA